MTDSTSKAPKNSKNGSRTRADLTAAFLSSQLKDYPDLRDPVVLMGLRGWFSDGNQRGIYDDAIVLFERRVQPKITDGRVIRAYRANTDPSDWNKGVAILQSGLYLYKRGLHGLGRAGKAPYPALRQASPVRVKREGMGDREFIDKFPDFFWINIHCGSVNSTSSAGCQTIQPSQWQEFRALTYDLMEQYKMELIPYVLLDA